MTTKTGDTADDEQSEQDQPQTAAVTRTVDRLDQDGEAVADGTEPDEQEEDESDEC